MLIDQPEPGRVLPGADESAGLGHADDRAFVGGVVELPEVDVADRGAQGSVGIGAVAQGAIEHGDEEEKTAAVEAVALRAVAPETGFASALARGLRHVVVELGQGGKEGIGLGPVCDGGIHGLCLVRLPTATGQGDHGLGAVDQATQQLKILLQAGGFGAVHMEARTQRGAQGIASGVGRGIIGRDDAEVVVHGDVAVTAENRAIVFGENKGGRLLEHGIEALDALRFGEVDFVEQDPFAVTHGLGQHALDETESALGRGGEAPDQLARIGGTVEIETADALAQKMGKVENGGGFGRRGFAF